MIEEDLQVVFCRVLRYAIAWQPETPSENLEKLLELGVEPEALESFDADKGEVVPDCYAALYKEAVAYFRRTGHLIDAKTLVRIFKEGAVPLLAEKAGIDRNAVCAAAKVALREAALDNAANGSDLDLLAEKVTDHWQADGILKLLYDASKRYGKVRPSNLLTYMSEQADRLRQRAGVKQVYVSARESVFERVKRYEEVESNPDKAKGLGTGFSTFDHRTGGLYNKDGNILLIVGGPKIGKSLLRDHLLANFWAAGHSVAVVLSEISVATAQTRVEMMSLARRELTMPTTDLSLSQALRRGELGPEGKKEYYGVLADFGERPGDFLFISPGSYNSLDELEGVIQHLKARYGIVALGVDDMHNQVLLKAQGERDDLRQGECLSWLKKMASRYELVGIGEVQESRETVNQRDAVRERVIMYSSKFLHQADIVWRLFRTSHPAYPELQVLAHRHEDDSDFRFRITMDKKLMLIGDAPDWVANSSPNFNFASVFDEEGDGPLAGEEQRYALGRA